METWNVVITVHEGYYREALEILEPLGTLSKTDFFNVLVLKVADTQKATRAFQTMWDEAPHVSQAIARFVPVSHTFFYTNVVEFEKNAIKTAFFLTRELEGKKFHVRMHRRGFKKRISSLEEEIFLDRVLLEALEKRGTAGSISFSDPDAVIVIETVGQQAGMALFTREELASSPFLHVD